MNKCKFHSLLGPVLFLVSFVYGQSDTSDSFEHPGIGSSVLRKGHFDFEIYTSIGKYYQQFITENDVNTLNKHQNVKAINTSLYYGVFKNFNFGLRYQFLSIKETFILPDGEFISRYNINNFGPTIRLGILKKNSIEAYLQSSALIPLDKFVGHKNIVYTNQLIVTGRIGYSFLWSLQMGAEIYPKYGSDKNPVSLPVNIFGAYLVNNKFMPFILVNHTTDFGSVDWLEDNKYYRLNYSTSLGIGFKYRLQSNLAFNAYYYRSIQNKTDEYFNNLMFGINWLF